MLTLRLLKSGAAVGRFDVPTEGAVPVVETYEHCTAIHAHIYP